MRRHYRHIFTTIYCFNKINSSRHNTIMAFEIRYYNANSYQRRYRIRYWIPMFIGTPCISTHYNYNLVDQWAIACLKILFTALWGLVNHAIFTSPMLPIGDLAAVALQVHGQVSSTIWPISISKYVHKYCILQMFRD